MPIKHFFNYRSILLMFQEMRKCELRLPSSLKLFFQLPWTSSSQTNNCLKC